MEGYNAGIILAIWLYTQSQQVCLLDLFITQLFRCLCTFILCTDPVAHNVSYTLTYPFSVLFAQMASVSMVTSNTQTEVCTLTYLYSSQQGNKLHLIAAEETNEGPGTVNLS